MRLHFVHPTVRYAVHSFISVTRLFGIASTLRSCQALWVLKSATPASLACFLLSKTWSPASCLRHVNRMTITARSTRPSPLHWNRCMALLFPSRVFWLAVFVDLPLVVLFVMWRFPPAYLQHLTSLATPMCPISVSPMVWSFPPAYLQHHTPRVSFTIIGSFQTLWILRSATPRVACCLGRAPCDVEVSSGFPAASRVPDDSVVPHRRVPHGVECPSGFPAAPHATSQLHVNHQFPVCPPC